MSVLEYKCPNCGSGMAFDSATGKLSCHSCGRKDDIEQYVDPLMSNIFAQAEASEYHCNSCGAVITTDAETTATVCSFCGAAVVLGDRLTGKLTPAKVIPFAISKEQAMQAFRKWCKNGRLTPDGFMTADRMKSVTGVYVPFWLYELHNQVEVHSVATKVRTYTSGDYHYTETQHFDVYRKLQLNYSKVPIDASEKMNDVLMDKLEPFPYNEMKNFKTPYLAGFIAEKYNYDAEGLFPRAQNKIRSYIEDAIQSSVVGYTTVNFTNKEINTRVDKADYALLPVWVVHYDYNKLEHTFAMNGQTGKVVGKPPLSKVKIMAWFGSISAASLILLKAVSWMMGGGFL
jgi:DNA-directed RNA polymerase subunit RPC12/RpoP